MKKTDRDLLATAQNYLNNAQTVGDLTQDQADALDYYLGKLYGNEVEGRSKVVTREVLETIESQMPELMRVFSSEEAVEFIPVGEEDIEAAKQETKVVRHVAFETNPGFKNIYDTLKDGALQRVGYARVMMEEEEEMTEERLSLDPMQYAMLDDILPDNVEVIEVVEERAGDMVVGYEVTIQTTQTRKHYKWVSVPPEEMRIGRGADSTDLDSLNFVAQVRKLTRSKLVQMGYDRKLVDNLPAFGEEFSTDELEVSRAVHSGEYDNYPSIVESAMAEIEVADCFFNTDYDDDGIAELRFVRIAGNKVLENEEAQHNEFIGWSPIPMPHQHVGLSLADPVMDLQLQSSTLMRQVYDNLYLTNAPMREVDINKIPPEYMDLHTKSVPGGMLPTTQIGSIAPVTVPFTAAASIPIMDIIEQQKSRRTGVSEAMMGLDPNVLAKSTEGAFMGAMERQSGRMELVARIYAETFLKKLFLKIHALLQRNQDEEMVVNINNKFIPVQPSMWRRRQDMTVLIGTGNATTMQRAATAKSVMDIQRQIIEGGGYGTLVKAEHVYNAASDFVSAIGKRSADRYFQDPAENPPQPPQEAPNPLAEAEQVKAEARLQEVQFKAQSDMERQAAQQAHDEQMAKIEAEYRAYMEQVKTQLDRVDLAKDRDLKAQIEAEKIAMQSAIKDRELDLEKQSQELKYREMEIDRQFRLKELELQMQAAGEGTREKEQAAAGIEQLRSEIERAKQDMANVVISLEERRPKRKTVSMTLNGKTYTADVSEGEITNMKTEEAE